MRRVLTALGRTLAWLLLVPTLTGVFVACVVAITNLGMLDSLWLQVRDLLPADETDAGFAGAFFGVGCALVVVSVTGLGWFLWQGARGGQLLWTTLQTRYRPRPALDTPSARPVREVRQ